MSSYDVLFLFSSCSITLRETCWEKVRTLRVNSTIFTWNGELFWKRLKYYNFVVAIPSLWSIIQNNQAPPVFFPWFRLVLYNIMNYKMCELGFQFLTFVEYGYLRQKTIIFTIGLVIFTCKWRQKFLRSVIVIFICRSEFVLKKVFWPKFIFLHYLRSSFMVHFYIDDKSRLSQKKRWLLGDSISGFVVLNCLNGANLTYLATLTSGE